MGRPAYWHSASRCVTVAPLGDANRGCAYLALQPAGSNLSRPGAPTPRAPGLSFSARFFSLALVERAHEARRHEHHQLRALKPLGLALEQVTDDRDLSEERDIGAVLLRNREVFKFWTRLGLQYMFLGLEAIDEEGLRKFRKRISLGKAFEALEFARSLERLAPFGAGFQYPTFAARDLRITESRQLGAAGQHWRARLRAFDSVPVEAIFFDHGQLAVLLTEAVAHPTISSPATWRIRVWPKRHSA